MDDLRARAEQLRDRADALARDAAELVDALVVATPTAMPDDDFPATLLDAARRAISDMRAQRYRPNQTALATDLRRRGFRVGKERALWDRLCAEDAALADRAQPRRPPDAQAVPDAPFIPGSMADVALNGHGH